MMERATDFGACENLKEVAELEAVSNGMGEWNASGVKMTRKAYEFVMGEQTLKDLQFEGRMLEDLLTLINNGNNPVCFISRTGAICGTAAMLSQ